MSIECKGNSKLSKEVIEYLENLSKRLAIKTVILFGSRQKGKQFKYSDYDLFLISDTLPENYSERIDLIWQDKPLWVNVIPWRAKEIRDNIHRPFILQILLNGEIIYGSNDEFKKLANEYVTFNQLVETKYGFVPDS